MRLRCKHIPGLVLHFIPIQVNGLSCNTRHDPWTPVALFLRENQTIVFLNFIKPIILSPVYRTQWAKSNHLFFLPKENLKRYLHTGMIHCRFVCRIDAICYGNSNMDVILRKLIHTPQEINTQMNLRYINLCCISENPQKFLVADFAVESTTAI